jgi:hypothetical protein
MVPQKARLILMVGITAMFLAVSVAAQFSDRADLNRINRDNAMGVKPAASPFSLIDLSKVRWSHSYSVAYFSGGGRSGSLGMWNSAMLYEISSKLSLAINLGVAHNPGGLWSSADHDATFLPGFHLDFHPSAKFRMSVSFQRVMGYAAPYWPGYGYRYGPGLMSD